ncbi:MAG: DUF2723 domain-containing protein [Anaerolineae bacterium]
MATQMRSGATIFLGAGLGLYLSRVLAEFGPLDGPWPLVLCLALGLVATGIVLTALAHRQRATLSPLALCYLYVLYPRVDPPLALAVAFLVAAAFLANARNLASAGNLLANARRLFAPLPWDAVVFAAGLALYGHTLAPTLLPADSGEFQLVSASLGIAHPPGYPLYTLLGRLFTLIPLGDLAYRVNLMSAFFAALALALVSRATRHLTASGGAGMVAALSLGAATTFWAQATTANIRSLTALFTALLLWLLLRIGDCRLQTNRYLVLFAFCLGLAMTHHGSLAFLSLPFAAFLLLVNPRLLTEGRLLLRMGGAFALALTVLLYLPLRGAMGAPLDPGGLTTLRGFLNHVLARGFRGDVFYFTAPSILLDRLAVLANILDIQFGLPLLGLACLGLLALIRRQPRHALLIGGVFAVNALVAITYRAPQTVEYLMPAYVALALLVGYGAFALGQITPHPSLQALLLALLLLPGAKNLWANYPSYLELSHDRSTREYTEGILRAAPPRAKILSNWHYATAFWYLQTVEGLRPHVEVDYVHPQGAEPMGDTWRRRLEESAPQGPVVLTNRYPQFAATPYRPISFHSAFLVGGDASVPQGAREVGVTFDDRFRLLAYEMDEQELAPGGSTTLRLYWQPLVELDRDYSFFVHLVDGAGTVWGQRDVTHRKEELREGEILVDEMVLPLLPTIAPGRYDLIAGVYFTLPQGGWQRLTASSGGDAVQLAQVEVEGATAPPVTAHRLYQPFAGRLTLLGADYDTSRPEGLRVYLHWRVPDSRVSAAETGRGRPFRAHIGMYRVYLYANGQRVAEGEIAAAEAPFYLTTAHDVPPDIGALELELRAADGALLAPLGPWRWPLRDRVQLPPVPSGARYLVFGGEMALVGARYERRGETVQVDLRWLALRPLRRDYTVSVQLMGQGWRAQDDSTPALGAIPTLKWVRGMVVNDRHRLELPSEASGPASLRVAIYDAFTLEPLTVLDDWLLKLGQGQAVEVGMVAR